MIEILVEKYVRAALVLTRKGGCC